MITVDLGDGVIREMDEALLTPRITNIDNDREQTKVTEFLLDGKVVHRSVHVHLKHGLGIEGALGGFGG